MKISSWPGLQLLLFSKTYFADILYDKKKYFIVVPATLHNICVKIFVKFRNRDGV